MMNWWNKLQMNNYIVKSKLNIYGVNENRFFIRNDEGKEKEVYTLTETNGNQ